MNIRAYKLMLIAVLMLAGMAVPARAFAAGGFAFEPATGIYPPGDTFSVNVYADPKGTMAYTAKVTVEYPISKMRLKEFVAGPNTITLSQSGYDFNDPAMGRAVKTVGVPGGFNGRVLVGVATFKVVGAEGPTKVSIGGDSLLLDAYGQNIVSDFGAAAITIGTPPPAPATTTATTTDAGAAPFPVPPPPTADQLPGAAATAASQSDAAPAAHDAAAPAEKPAEKPADMAASSTSAAMAAPVAATSSLQAAAAAVAAASFRLNPMWWSALAVLVVLVVGKFMMTDLA